MDERLALVIAISFVGWLLSVSNHRRPWLRCRMRVPRPIAALAGSRTEWVDGESLAFQMGWLSLPLWCLLFGFSNFGICVLLDGFSTILLRKGFRYYAKRSNEKRDR